MSNFDEILYSESFNKARSSFLKSSGILYVEDISDVSFWELFFKNLAYEIKVFQNDTNQCITGKTELKKLYEKCNKHLLVALDSDYDYLCENHNDYAQKMCNNPFIIHTYSYSKESVIYNSGYIDFILEKLSLYQKYLDFESNTYLQRISNLIFPLLVEKLFIIENYPQDSEKQISNLNNLMERILDFNKKNIEQALVSATNCSIQEEHFKSLEDSIVPYLDSTIPHEKISEFVKYLENKGLNKDNAYRFINGHTLKEKIILPFIYSIHKKRKAYESENLPDYGSTQNSHKIGQIHNHFNENCDIKTLLVSHMEKIMNMSDPILSKIVGRTKNLNIN